MKTLLLCVALCTTANAQQKLDCTEVEKDARYAMIARQINEPIERPLRYFQKAIVEHAYEFPVGTTAQSIKEYVEEFQRKYKETCEDFNNGR